MQRDAFEKWGEARIRVLSDRILESRQEGRGKAIFYLLKD